MVTFYICRHGQTENNKLGILSGWADTPLTDEGRRNALVAAHKLKNISFDRIICSDLGRCRTTAEIIAKEVGFAGKIEPTPALREVNYGELTNKPITSYPALTAYENSTFAAAGGESLSQMQQRVMAYIHTAGAGDGNPTILLVAHDGTINAVRSSFTGQDIGVVDAASRNSHDLAAKFILEDGSVSSFAELN